MRTARSTSDSFLSYLVFLLCIGSFLQSWASPLPFPSSAISPSANAILGRSVPGIPEGILSKHHQPLLRREHLEALNAGSGWTMNFMPLRMVLPIHSGALVLKELYSQAIVHAVKAELSKQPEQQALKIFIGALGMSQSAHLQSAYCSNSTSYCVIRFEFS